MKKKDQLYADFDPQLQRANSQKHGSYQKKDQIR